MRDLRVDASPITRTYLRFKVDVTSGDVRHVSLLLYSRTRSSAGVRVRLVEDAWREQRITFLNAPPLEGQFVSSGPFKARAWRAINVTSLAEDVSDDYVSLVLTTPSASGLELASRETGLHGPRLVVERESGDGPTTTAEEGGT